MEENITLILKAYTDSGYTNLKWTYERIVTVHWINSADAAFTVDFLNNFDDGTVQGWALTCEVTPSNAGSLGIATDYVLSAPYSLKMKPCWYGGGEGRSYISKSFSTPNKSKIFAIADVRMAHQSGSNGGLKTLRIQNGTAVLVFLGKPYDTVASANYIPKDKWMRIVVPLPANASVDFRIDLDYYTGTGYEAYLWLDDFRIISK
jgi:hypothetical protein